MANNKSIIPTCELARAKKVASTTTNAAGYTINFATTRTLSARKKRTWFRRTMLDAAKTAYAAGNLTAANLALITKLYRRPWRTNSTTGASVDVLDLVRNTMSAACKAAQSGTTVYINDWWGQSITVSAQKTTPRVWLATAGAMTSLVSAIGTRTSGTTLLNN